MASPAQISAIAQSYGAPKWLGDSLGATSVPESGGNSRATSSKGAKGLLQIYPHAWPELDSGGDLYNDDYNIRSALYVISKQGSSAWSRSKTWRGPAVHAGQFNFPLPSGSSKPSSQPQPQLTSGLPGGNTTDQTINQGVATIGDLIALLTDPSKLAAMFAKTSAFFIRIIGRAMWDYCIAPPWHWTERAVDYYYKEVMSDEGEGFYYSNAGIITMLFWGIGYGVLWASVDDDNGYGLARTPRDSMLGRAIQNAQLTTASRKLTKPGDTGKATPNKPTPETSRSTIAQTRTIATNRRRPVTVTTIGGKDDGSGQRTGDTTGGGEAEAVEPQAGRKRVRIQAA